MYNDESEEFNRKEITKRKLEINDENNIVAESVLFFTDFDQDAGGDLGACLKIRDVEGNFKTVFLPVFFTQNVIFKGYEALTNEKKSDKDFKRFLRQYRLYMNPNPDEEALRDLFFSEDGKISFVVSNLRWSDEIDDGELSEDILE